MQITLAQQCLAPNPFVLHGRLPGNYFASILDGHNFPIRRKRAIFYFFEKFKFLQYFYQRALLNIT